MCLGNLLSPLAFFFFFFNDTATTEIYTLSLHDALPICRYFEPGFNVGTLGRSGACSLPSTVPPSLMPNTSTRIEEGDRKSTRLNSSHLVISYAVFCLKKKKKE